MTKREWSPFDGLTPRGRTLLKAAVAEHEKRDGFLERLQKSSASHNALSAKELDRLTPIHNAHLQLEKEGKITPHHLTVAEATNAALHLNLLTAHMEVTSAVLRRHEAHLMYLETVAIHAFHSAKRSDKTSAESGLMSLLGDHGVRLLSVEEKFEDFERRMSGTLGDLYSRMSAGERIEPEK